MARVDWIDDTADDDPVADDGYWRGELVDNTLSAPAPAPTQAPAPDPPAQGLVSHDRLTRIEARLTRIEHEMKRLTSYLLSPAGSVRGIGDFPDANLGVD